MTTFLSKLKRILSSHWRNRINIICSPKCNNYSTKSHAYHTKTNNMNSGTQYNKWSHLSKYHHQSCSLFYNNKCAKQLYNKSYTRNVKKPMINVSKTIATITGLATFCLSANIVAFGEWYPGVDLSQGEQLETVIEIDTRFHKGQRMHVTDYQKTVTSASTKWGHIYADYYCYMNEKRWRQFKKYKMKKYSIIYTLIINEIYKNNIYIGANEEMLFNGNWKHGDEISIEIDLKNREVKCIVNDEIIETKELYWYWKTACLFVKMRHETCLKCGGKGAVRTCNLFQFFCTTECDKCCGSGYFDSSVTLKKCERRMELK
eukprot:433624_1